MRNAIKVKLAAKCCAEFNIPEPSYIIVNENQICWINSGGACNVEGAEAEAEAVLHMANGDIIYISDPPYHAWENDTIIA